MTNSAQKQHDFVSQIRRLVNLWENESNPEKKRQIKAVLEDTIDRMEVMKTV